jgi:hypothetical protein
MKSRLPRFFRIGILLVLLGTLPTLVRSEDSPADDNARAAEALDLAKKEAATYRFRLEDGGSDFAFQPEAVLKFTNPVFGTVFGDVFVWTAKGRPAVIGAFVKWYHPYHHSTDEFHSLSLTPVIGEKSGRPAWNSSRPGLEWTAIPDAPAPAATAAQRLRQMRELVKQFSGRHIDEKGVDRDLRLLTHPLYRYEGTEDDPVDGALFAFTIGTDPEAFLLIETRKAAEARRWHYALCRMTAVAVRASHHGKEVWSVPALDFATAYSGRAPYTKFPGPAGAP